MDYKELIGIVLIFLGLFLVIVQPISPTGAVIDLSTSKAKLSFFVGFLMIIGGIVLILASRERIEGGLVDVVDSGAIKKNPSWKNLCFPTQA